MYGIPMSRSEWGEIINIKWRDTNQSWKSVQGSYFAVLRGFAIDAMVPPPSASAASSASCWSRISCISTTLQRENKEKKTMFKLNLSKLNHVVKHNNMQWSIAQHIKLLKIVKGHISWTKIRVIRIRWRILGSLSRLPYRLPDLKDLLVQEILFGC